MIQTKRDDWIYQYLIIPVKTINECWQEDEKVMEMITDMELLSAEHRDVVILVNRIKFWLI